MRRTAVILVIVLSALAFAVAAVTAPVLWLAIDETALPPATDAPPLPDGFAATDPRVNCASGGCWREWTVSGPHAWSTAEVAAGINSTGERCGPRSLLDRREVCWGLEVVGEEVRLFLRFDRPLD